ncbi:MAG TPA: N-acetyl-gamma-glutamyl-phosphate reductase [Bacteroidota bacterium]|nr:N-acetyl-gamma-glutamyl-phosphate reductase [Bacteroidota bacterium]
MITASIIGASGYSGFELTKLLLRHSSVKLQSLFANSSAGKRVDEIYPSAARLSRHRYETYSIEAACSSDVVFIALPSGEAMKIVPELLDRGKKVIDLGGDFRLDRAAEYERYYKHDHIAPELLHEGVYGLPEWNANAIKQARLIANPGCYPTSALLPLLPLLKENAIQPHGIIINSLSGVSGAGRSSSAELSFAEVNESVKAYKVMVHQHIPEIKHAVNLFAACDASFSFVPHLLPITRGIYTTIYAPVSNDLSEDKVFSIYHSYYEKEPFVRYSAIAIPEIKNVVYTNSIDIGFRIDRDNNRLIVFSAIDNLIKGAAGQAVQNMNLLFGFDETEGLL